MTAETKHHIDTTIGTSSAAPLKRLRYPLCGILMVLCIGNVYTWSVFRNPLMKTYGWTMAEATYPFQISIAVFAIAMVFAGRWQDKSGPHPVAMLGGILSDLPHAISVSCGIPEPFQQLLTSAEAVLLGRTTCAIPPSLVDRS